MNRTAVAIYARYSSDNQREASIDDQLRECRAFIKGRGWTVAQEFTDAQMSGASKHRPGYQALIQAALAGRFAVVVAESLDRLSRDQEDTAGLFKRLTFAGVKIVTLAEGDIGAMAVGFKGTMNAMYLTDLKAKTQRGMRGQVEKGQSGGGLCYGYDVAGVGHRTINAAEAAVLVRIFTAYANGTSPTAIAKVLNAEGIPGPGRSLTWGPSTIHGHAPRGTGILNNELYIGRLIWNRRTWLKDPDTGKRVPRENTPDQWSIIDVPDLRIIPDALWRAVKLQQQAQSQGPMREGRGNRGARRPRYIFSGLIKCGVCGRGMVATNFRMTCGGYLERGTCDNDRRVAVEEVDTRVLAALQDRFFSGPHFDAFCDEFRRLENEVRMEHRAQLAGAERELAAVRTGLKQMIEAFKVVGANLEMKVEWDALQARKVALETRLATAAAPAPLLHPNMAALFRDQVIALRDALMDDNRDDAARQAVRKLVEEIRITPAADGPVAIEVTGDIAAMLTAANPADWQAYTAMVAGARIPRCVPNKVAA